jgi:hypothetical protein
LPLFRSRITWHDAPASVRRSYTPAEMRDLMAHTGSSKVQISRHFLFRMGVLLWKWARSEIQVSTMTAIAAQFDLAIVGAGPAGSSAGITATRHGARVGLFEAKDFPRHRVCGEFVSAEALDVLAGLLENVPFAASLFQNAPAIENMGLLLGGRVIESPVHPPALSISRHDLDALLWEAARGAG